MQTDVRVRNNTANRAGTQSAVRRPMPRGEKTAARPGQKDEGRQAIRREAVSSGTRQFNKKYAVSSKGRTGVRHPNRKKKMKAARTRSYLIVQEKVSSKSPFPVFAIATCFVVTAVFMYMLSLYVKLDNYNADISSMQTQIAELGEQATVLEVSIERKFNLDMVEKTATEEYGMVSVDGLPKSYVSVSGEDEYTAEKIDSGEKDTGSVLSSVSSKLNIE